MPIFKKTKQKYDEHEIIIGCDCGTNEHQINLGYYDDDKDFLSIQPCIVRWCGFWKRLIIAIKYLFGYKSRYGQWDEVLLTRDDVVEVVEFLKGFVDASKT